MNEQLISDAIQRQWPDRVQVLKELLSERIEHLQIIMNERQAAIKMALDLNAIEHARRFELLNGEAQRLQSMQVTYLPREVYAQNHAETTKAIVELGKFAANQHGRGQVISIVISSVISVIVGLFFIVVTRVLH